MKFLQQSGTKAKVKQRFDKKVVSDEEGKQNEKFLHILIFKCESDWAYAMNMKKAISNAESGKQEEAKAGLKNQSQFNQRDENSNRNPNRLRLHSKKRFERVYKSCEQLMKVSEECLDGFSKFEMQAYIESMKASYLIEA